MRRYAVFFIAFPVAALCVRLGAWQLSRLHQRRVHNTSLRAAMALPPIQLAGDSIDVAESRAVRADGRFDYSREIVLDARVVNGVPAVIVVTPLQLGNGAAVLVERGWVPSPDGHTVDLSPLQEADTLTVVGLVLAPGPDAPSPRDSTWPKHVQWPSPGSLAALYPYPLLPFVILRTGVESQGTALRPMPPPELTDGPHLGYAVQWFSFAIIVIVGSVFLHRREKSSPSY